MSQSTMIFYIGGELEWVVLRIITRKELLKLCNRVLEHFECVQLLSTVACVKCGTPGNASFTQGVLGGCEVHVDARIDEFVIDVETGIIDK